MAPTRRAPVVVVSNRGPVAFVAEPGVGVVEKRGVGGLVTALTAALKGRTALWIASAITDEDRARAGTGQPIVVPLGPGHGAEIQMVTIDPDVYDGYYNQFSNRVIWFLHHALWEQGTPEFGAVEREAWEAYQRANVSFAEAVALLAPRNAVAFVQDYHLCLVPALLREVRPDLRVAHFWHIPFADPARYREIPDDWGAALLAGLLSADRVGFQAEPWATAFIECCREILGIEARGRTLIYEGRSVQVGVHPIGVDVEHLEEQASQPEVAKAEGEIAMLAAGRKVLLRVDRTEPSKNILRGLRAYELLLERRPDLHRTVVHLAMLTPSRRHIREYQEYTAWCVGRAQGINDRFGTPDWQPVVLEIEDDFARALAGYRQYDILLVNPVYDGMNLVAREGPLLNERGGVLVLSRNAGASAALRPAALLVNPYDVEGTATALAQALDMPERERLDRAARLRPLARGMPPHRWLEEQLGPLE